MRCALQGHGADDILPSSSTAVEDLRDLADERLVGLRWVALALGFWLVVDVLGKGR
ncbi:hypothetical protein [Streptomyces sp. V1I1]|uniref:hypothetical protein n=1 Tax=Streptomyces sp. V1I1 TaxID=3042272 RepID=UPI002785104A|nr:hypothetical protein [Streptomyces sp. V1I1]MDQ0938362.1 hypothetical protein [Streptomyces sp. V1I1]